MYCKYCGKPIDDDAVFCAGCGREIAPDNAVQPVNDKPNVAFSLLGFFVPVVGLILYLVYEHKMPKRAKSAGKGALIGFVVGIALSVVASIVGSIFASSLIKSAMDIARDPASNIGYIHTEDDVDVEIGEFTATKDDYMWKTSLEVTVTNKADDMESYFITIEAVDDAGMRLDTDSVMVDRLNPGQKTRVTMFEYVDEDKIEAYKTATFHLLQVED